MSKPPEWQLTCAQERARKARLTITCIGFDDRGLHAKVTSERDPHIEYTITSDQATGCLVCTCPASVVCKHIGALLNEGASYYTNAKRPEDVPVTPNPNRSDDPEPESTAPSPAPASRESAIASVLKTMPYQQRCECCGQSWHVKTLAQHYICPTCAWNDREQLEDYWREFPMLMDIAAEVAAVEAQMEAEGFIWSAMAQTWVSKPELGIILQQQREQAVRAARFAPKTLTERAAAALPADRTPETFSIFAEGHDE